MRSTAKLRRLCDAEVSQCSHRSTSSLSFTSCLLECVGAAGAVDQRAVIRDDLGVDLEVGLPPAEGGPVDGKLVLFIEPMGDVVWTMRDDAPLHALDLLVEASGAVERGVAHEHVVHAEEA